MTTIHKVLMNERADVLVKYIYHKEEKDIGNPESIEIVSLEFDIGIRKIEQIKGKILEVHE